MRGEFDSRRCAVRIDAQRPQPRGRLIAVFETMVLKHPPRREFLVESNELVTESRKAKTPVGDHDRQEAQPRAGVGDRVEVRPGYRVLAVTGDVAGQAASNEKRLRHPAEASFDRDFLPGEADQAGGIDQCRRRIVGESHERAAKRKAARARIQKIELKGDLQ